VIEVVRGGFTLERQLVKGLECIECKYGPQALDGCRDPASAEDLRAFVENSVALTAVTEIYANAMDTTGIDNKKVRWPR
jgi:hypothetical protein